MSLQGFLDYVLPAPLNPVQIWRVRNHDILVSDFIQASHHLASHLHRLIIEAEASLALLNRMEEYVDVMNEMISRDNIIVQEEKDRIVSLAPYVGKNFYETRLAKFSVRWLNCGPS